MRRLSKQEVIGYTKGRAILETQLCTEMYALFNSPALLNPIRDVVATAIEQILVMMQYSEKDWGPALRAAGANLAVWKHAAPQPQLTAEGLMNVWKKRTGWSADDCGDLIRLFGGLIEDRSLKGHAVDQSVDDLRGSKRVFGFGKDERVRTTTGFTTSVEHIGAAHTAILGSKRVSGGFSGIGNISLSEQSTVKKIDSAYGLAEGCDISGTTADSIFFFSHVSAFLAGLTESLGSDVLPVIQLFPMATMASQGHHTVLECALTLTQNAIIDYRVGFYSTLMPPGSENAALSRLFAKYENDPRNVQMLCWHDGATNLLGGVRFDKPWEVKMLRDASLANPALLTDFKALGPTASRRQLLGMTRFRTLGMTLGLA